MSWSLTHQGGLLLARCAVLDTVPGLIHGFSSGLDAAGRRFDAGSAMPEDRDAAEARARFGQALGLGREVSVLHQVHGADLVDPAIAAAAEESTPAADGWVLGRRQGGWAVRTADCVPVLIACREGSAAAAVHAGWRGTAARIVPAALERLSQLGVASSHLLVALGPSVSGASYPVSLDVVRALGQSLAARFGPQDAATGLWHRIVGEAHHVDLHSVLRLQLIQAGVAPSAIHAAPWCTRLDRRFHSYRRDGPGAGRAIAAVGWSRG